MLGEDWAFIEVEVKNRPGEPVTDLKYTDFIIYENGKRQKIEFFSSENIAEEKGFPVAYTIAYYPENKPGGNSARKIRVEVRVAGKSRLKVKYRPESYLYKVRK